MEIRYVWIKEKEMTWIQYLGSAQLEIAICILLKTYSLSVLLMYYLIDINIAHRLYIYIYIYILLI
jgi:hypothetical protein